MELTLIQTLQFNLLVPTSVEFVSIFLMRLEELCGHGTNDPLLLDMLPAWTTKYLQYLAKDFSNIDFNQSEKALACTFCAVARWSIRGQSLASAEQEAEAMKAALTVILGETEPTGNLANASAVRLHSAWRAVAARPDLDSICTVRCRFIERSIISAIGNDEDTMYPAVRPSDMTWAASSLGSEKDVDSTSAIETADEEEVEEGMATPKKLVGVEEEDEKGRDIQRQHQTNEGNKKGAKSMDSSAFRAPSPTATSDLASAFDEEDSDEPMPVVTRPVVKRRASSLSSRGKLQKRL
jgi:hypothetical protein